MYAYRYAHRQTHEPLKNLEQIRKRAWEYNFSLFYNGKPIGDGDLEVRNFHKKWVHTDGMMLYTGFRKKGHGIHLYRAIFTAAKRLGAKRVYSSQNLNKFSRRMWSVKIERDLKLKVHTVVRCRNGCKHCTKKPIYYIEL